jgi:hypothetical protein
MRTVRTANQALLAELDRMADRLEKIDRGRTLGGLQVGILLDSILLGLNR